MQMVSHPGHGTRNERVERGYWERCLLSSFQCFWYLNVLTSHCIDLRWYPSHVTSSREGAFNQWER